MKIISALSIAISLLIAAPAIASNVIRIQAPVKQAEAGWISIDPIFSEWRAVSEMYGCTGAIPAASAYVEGQEFQQTQTGCKQDFERNVQAREQHSSTGAIRNKGVATQEPKTDTNLQYTKKAMGTRNGMEILYGAGKGSLSGGSLIAGIYARKGELDIGTLQAINGGRVLAYFIRTPNSETCELRFATTGMDGWVTAGAPTTQAMIAYTTAVKKAELYLAGGALFATYTFNPASTSPEGGSIRRAAVPCAVVNTFYANPSYFSKITLLK